MMNQPILDAFHLRQIRHVLPLHLDQLIVARWLVEWICPWNYLNIFFQNLYLPIGKVIKNIFRIERELLQKNWILVIYYIYFKLEQNKPGKKHGADSVLLPFCFSV